MKFDFNIKDNVIVNIEELKTLIECQSETFLENILNYLKYNNFDNSDELINAIHAYLSSDKESFTLRQFIYQNNFKKLNVYKYSNEVHSYLVLNDDEGVIKRVLKVVDSSKIEEYINENYELLTNVPSEEMFEKIKSIGGEELELVLTDRVMYKKDMAEIKNRFNLASQPMYSLTNNLFVLGSCMFRIRNGKLDMINEPAVLKANNIEELDSLKGSFEDKIGSFDVEKFERVKSLVSKVYDLDEKIDQSGWNYIYLGVAKMIKDMIKADQNKDMYFEKTGIYYNDLVSFLEYFMAPLVEKYNNALENVEENTLTDIETDLVLKYLNNKEYIIGSKAYTYTKKEHGASVSVMIIELAIIAALLVLFFAIDI